MPLTDWITSPTSRGELSAALPGTSCVHPQTARDERRVRARRRSRPAAQHWAPAACAARHGSACSLRARRVRRPRYAACRWAAGCSRQSTRRARRAGQLPRTSVMMCCPVRSWRTLTPMPTRVSCWRVPGTLASLLLNSADRNSAIPAPRRNARLLKSVCWCGARCEETAKLLESVPDLAVRADFSSSVPW